MRENSYQSALIKRIERIFPDAIVIKLDPTYIQGIPDLLVLLGDKWAALECKRNINEHRQPNQEYYISLMDQMSYASFVFPENEEEVLNGLQQALKSRRTTRVSKRKQISLD